MVNKVSMKQYLIDELRRDDHKKLKAYLDDNLLPSSFDCTYWLKLDKKILTPLQKSMKLVILMYLLLCLKKNI